MIMNIASQEKYAWPNEKRYAYKSRPGVFNCMQMRPSANQLYTYPWSDGNSFEEFDCSRKIMCRATNYTPNMYSMQKHHMFCDQTTEL